jgi:hypothetical protein
MIDLDKKFNQVFAEAQNTDSEKVRYNYATLIGIYESAIKELVLTAAQKQAVITKIDNGIIGFIRRNNP